MGDLAFPMPLDQLLAVVGLHLAEFERLRNTAPALETWRIRATTILVAATAGFMVWAEVALSGTRAVTVIGLCAFAMTACVAAYSQRWPQTRHLLTGIGALALFVACCCEMTLLAIAFPGVILWGGFLACDDGTAE